MDLLALPPHLAEQVLVLLKPKQLAHLAATCTGLRALVQPEPIWKAAAHRDYAPTHPVHRAASVQGYLRQQRRLHANIATQHCQAVQLQGAQGSVSADGAKLATIREGPNHTTLRIIGVQADKPLLAQWRLPSRQEWVRRRHCQPWDHDGRMVALAIGGALTALLAAPTSSEYSCLTPSCAAGGWGFGDPEDEDNGNYQAKCALVDTTTGSCNVVELPPQEWTDEGESAKLCGWSRSGLLCMTHMGDTGTPELSVFDRAGVCVNSIAIPASSQGPAFYAQWVPFSAPLILVHSAGSWRGGTELWLWHVSDMQAQAVSTAPYTAEAVCFSPCGTKLLCVCKGPHHGLSMVDIESRATTRLVADRLFRVGRAVWGLQGIAATEAVPTARAGITVDKGLHLFTVQGCTLTLVHSLDVEQVFGHRGILFGSCAPDGVHLLAWTHLPEMWSRDGYSAVVVVNFLSGQLSQYPVTFAPGALQFCPAGATVLATDVFGTRHLQLEFA